MAPVFIRLFKTKPIRVFIDYVENEPDDYFGSSYCAALEGHYALQFAGYDYQWEFYPFYLGEGHYSRILPLPKNETPRRLTISGGYLSAQCGDKIYCRKIKFSAKEVSLEPKTPKFISYYD